MRDEGRCRRVGGVRIRRRREEKKNVRNAGREFRRACVEDELDSCAGAFKCVCAFVGARTFRLIVACTSYDVTICI